MTHNPPIPPQWVGRRVVVRYRLDRTPDGGRPAPDAGLTDAVGELLDGGDPLRVATRRGEVLIPRSAVIAAKQVPPRPSRPAPPHAALSIADLERLSVLHWRPVEEQPLGGWLLRAHHGVTGRANSALALGLPDDLPATLDAVRAWYAARELPAIISLAVPADADAPASGPPDGMPGEAKAVATHRRGHTSDGAAQLALQAPLDAAGWVRSVRAGAYAFTAATAAVAAREDLRRGADPALPVELSDELNPKWASLYRAGSLPRQVDGLLTSSDERVFVSIRDGGELVAIGRGSHASGWVGVTAVEVLPGHQRRGLGRLVLSEIARWGQRRRARSMFLDAGVDNLAAARLYLSAGFRLHHRYDYLTPG